MGSDWEGKALKCGCVHVVPVVTRRVAEGDEVAVGCRKITYDSCGGGGPVEAAKDVGAYGASAGEGKIVNYCAINEEESGSERD